MNNKRNFISVQKMFEPKNKRILDQYVLNFVNSFKGKRLQEELKKLNIIKTFYDQMKCFFNLVS